MLSENVFFLSSSSSVYDNFIGFLKNTFYKFTIINDSTTLINSLENYLSKYSPVDTGPLIMFVEYPFLAEMSPYLNNNLDNLSYVLIGFDSEDQSSIGNFGNIFDFVNTGKLNEKFLTNKLSNEIHNRKSITQLKYEVREFYEIGKSLSSEKDTVKLLEMIIASSIKLTSSDAGTIYLVIDKNSYNWTSIKDQNYKDKLLKFVISRNTSIDIDLETFTSPITKDSIFGYSVITGKPLRIDDAYKLDSTVEYHHNNSFDLRTGYVTRSILTIPMKDHENNILGVIQLINKKKNENEKIDYKNEASLSNIITYDFSDEHIMSSLAGQAAVVLENNLLYSNMKLLLDNLKKQNAELDILSKRILKAHEEERKRIAREIHDGPAQAVVNLSLKLELAKKYLQNDMPEEGFKELNFLNASIKSTSKEIRTILYDLKPSYLDDGLVKALENRLAMFKESTGLNVNFIVSGDDSTIEYYIVYSLYRMVQETLTNIQKHAKATNVIVDFRVYGNGISIHITDDGVGFDMETQSKKHQTLNGGFGLAGLKERVELLKGRFDINSAPAQGTSIMIYIPM
ncbi:GAF domain-containing sensor histidine kinase [Acetivibrio cellulolyticus]|uniref:GAF domain-containing sensor histidine kinase n=1 Tax=Acetivibrio cellulolyticus TaxID=35830 RepID=UPI0001E3018A|nr:GAF domain-containing sensor histidine kinase [Acetivibrio cellulolyticus]